MHATAGETHSGDEASNEEPRYLATFHYPFGYLLGEKPESIRLFKEAGRQELVDKEEAELALLLGFLPQQLTREELESLVDQVISETSATSGKDMGKVMKALAPSVSGRADGKLVSEVVKEKLA